MPTQQLGVDLADLYGKGFDQLRDQQHRLPGQLGYHASTLVEHREQVAQP